MGCLSVCWQPWYVYDSCSVWFEPAGVLLATEEARVLGPDLYLMVSEPFALEISFHLMPSKLADCLAGWLTD